MHDMSPPTRRSGLWSRIDSLRRWPRWSRWSTFAEWGLLGSILALGVAPRVAQYVYNRSLWFDEAALAVAIIESGFDELLPPLEYKSQVAPLGFLFGVKSLTKALGTSERVLRLIPFVSSIAALLLFWRLAARVSRRGAPLALCLFACSDGLIYYTVEFKQYSSDVLIAVLLTMMALEMEKSPLRYYQLGYFGLLGGLAMWCSHPAMLVLASSGTVIFGLALLRKDWARALRLAGIGALWGLAFLGSWLIHLSRISGVPSYSRFWSKSFAPKPTGVEEWHWYRDLWNVYLEFLGPQAVALAAFLLLAGILSMLSSGRLSHTLVLAPIPVVLLVSMLNIYPMGPRLILFLAPTLFLVLANGSADIRLPSRSASAFLKAVFSVVLLAAPVVSAFHSTVTPRLREEARPVSEYILDRWQQGDTLYLYYGAEPAYRYYFEIRAGFDGKLVRGVFGRNDWSRYESDLERLRGRGRVWFFFAHVHKRRGNERNFMLEYLDGLGVREDVVGGRGASAFLYQLGTAVKTKFPAG